MLILNMIFLSFHLFAGSWEEKELACLLKHPEIKTGEFSCNDKESELTKTICDQPKKFCENFRKKKKSKDKENYFDSSCKLFVAEKSVDLEEAEYANQLAKSLRENLPSQSLKKKEFDFPGDDEGIYQSSSWENANKQFDITKKILIDYYSNLNPSAPQIVIDKIKNTKLLSPYDGSVDLEKRKNAFDTCKGDDDLGINNAFANHDGFVVICPKFLISTNGEHLFDLLFHEVSHQVGPCLMAQQISDMLTAPNCDPTKSTDSRIKEIGSWIGRMKETEKCFLSAGINSGGDEKWIARQLKDILDNKEPEDDQKCLPRSEDFIRNKNPLKGTFSYCDHSNVKTVIMISQYMNLATEESKFKKLLLKIKTKLTPLKIKIPDANQFNESYSDWIAAKLMPQALKEWNKSNPSGLKLDIASSLSKFCSSKYHHLMKGEAHPLDDVRMGIYSSQEEMRELLGCESQPKSFAKKISQCNE